MVSNERKAELNRLFYAENKERILARRRELGADKAYYQKNKEKIKARTALRIEKQKLTWKLCPVCKLPCQGKKHRGCEFPSRRGGRTGLSIKNARARLDK